MTIIHTQSHIVTAAAYITLVVYHMNHSQSVYVACFTSKPTLRAVPLPPKFPPMLQSKKQGKTLGEDQLQLIIVHALGGAKRRKTVVTGKWLTMHNSLAIYSHLFHQKLVAGREVAVKCDPIHVMAFFGWWCWWVIQKAFRTTVLAG